MCCFLGESSNNGYSDDKNSIFYQRLENAMTTIAARLKSERERLAFTQIDIAKNCKISRVMWCRYEKGNSVPGGKVLQSFLEAGGDVHFVLSGKTPAAEAMLVKRFRACSKSLQDAILRTLKIATNS